jgi:hypothetical protein
MVHLYASANIPVAIGRVWTLMRDFDGLQQWQPMIRDSRIEDGHA